ncbi:hypothetical protein KDW49_04955 [Burkholderia dolosa]|nr:hypothetical protein [Burkholderia dolosa]
MRAFASRWNRAVVVTPSDNHVSHSTCFVLDSDHAAGQRCSGHARERVVGAGGNVQTLDTRIGEPQRTFAPDRRTLRARHRQLAAGNREHDGREERDGQRRLQ